MAPTNCHEVQALWQFVAVTPLIFAVMPYISVIIPVYNRPDLLRLALESLSQQSYRDFEVIVVDDGSIDDSVSEVAIEFQSRGLPLKFHRHAENQGLPMARNSGLGLAEGSYIAFLDSDDLYLPWTLQVMSETIHKESQPCFVAGSAVAIGGEDSAARAEQAPIITHRYTDYLEYRAMRKDWWFAPSGVVLRRDVIMDAGGFWSGRSYCEDIDLWQRLGIAPAFIRVEQPAIYGYRLHDGSMHWKYGEMCLGIQRIQENERTERYPGGRCRKRERLHVVTQHARHHALEFARAGQIGLAWRLYLMSFRWNFALGRFPFLFGFPAILAAGCFRRCWCLSSAIAGSSSG